MLTETKKELLKKIKSNFQSNPNGDKHIYNFMELVKLMVNTYEHIEGMEAIREINRLEKHFPYETLIMSDVKDIRRFFKDCKDAIDYKTALDFSEEFYEMLVPELTPKKERESDKIRTPEENTFTSEEIERQKRMDIIFNRNKNITIDGRELQDDDVFTIRR